MKKFLTISLAALILLAAASCGDDEPRVIPTPPKKEEPKKEEPKKDEPKKDKEDPDKGKEDPDKGKEDPKKPEVDYRLRFEEIQEYYLGKDYQDLVSRKKYDSKFRLIFEQDRYQNRMEYTYNDKDQIITEMARNYDRNLKEYEDPRKITYEYNSKGFLVKKKFSRKNKEYMTTNYKYLVDKLVTEEDIYSDGEVRTITKYDYNGDGLLISKIEHSGIDLRPIEAEFYDYNSKGLVSRYIKAEQGGDRVPTYIHKYTYNDEGQVAEEIYLFGDGATLNKVEIEKELLASSNLYAYDKYVYKFDTRGNWISAKLFEYNKKTKVWKEERIAKERKISYR